MTDYRTLKRVSRSIENLYNPKKREVALWDLRTLRHSVQDFGLILWHSFGTVAILIEVKHLNDTAIINTRSVERRIKVESTWDPALIIGQTCDC